MELEEVLDRNRRVIAIANVKGGVGKTSITANLAGELAHSGYKVLTIDLDPQGNLRNSLGYRDTPADDRGDGLVRSVLEGTPLVPTRQVRPNLDVVGGGIRTKELQQALQLGAMNGRNSASQLSQVLALSALNYDVVLLDTPPSPGMLQTSALVAARYILLPIEGDEDSLDGLETMAGEITNVRDRNPLIRPLGVVRFRMSAQATRTRDETKTASELMLGEGVAFTSVIRDAPSIGRMLKQGSLARDLDGRPPSALGVATDYAELAAEVLEVIAREERAIAQASQEALR